MWLSGVIQWAHERGVTDLHLFPSETDSALWARLDGQLHEVAKYSLSVHQRLVSRLKVLGRCADYSGDLVLEGRFSLNGRAEDGEARLSILPTLRGEKAVIRLLNGGARVRALDELGFADPLIQTLRKAVDRPQGLLLAVGPSGCGKSTALYALLRDLSQRAGRPLSIVTIEDPVEQSLSFAAQIGVEPARGLGFAEGLRAVLRQDPEVIMIGEIRDSETAQTALQAALTGHRLLSSMHTLSAGEALVRLQQMGSPAYVIASALAGVLNLRLARLLCPHCKTTRELTPEELDRFPEAREWTSLRSGSQGGADIPVCAPSQSVISEAVQSGFQSGADIPVCAPARPVISEPVGCPACLGSGYLGRTGIGEWLLPTAETGAALQANRAAVDLARTMEAVVSARPAALDLLREGRISLDEWESLSSLGSIEP